MYLLVEKLEYYIHNNKLYFENIYSPSAIIDSAWKLLIQNTKIYREFCYELWGAFIDRVEPQSNQLNDNRYAIKYSWLDQFFLDYNNYFKKYDPLHENFYDPKYILFSIKHFVKIKKEYLSSIINYIDEKVIDYDIDQATTDKVFNLWDEIYWKIFINNTDVISVSEADNELSINSILNPEKYSSYPLVFIQLLTKDFNKSLLSSFEQVYCLRNSDVILIMVEYLKFLTICKIYNENFSPSFWVDQFWHHHMSYDTKYYREFWENIFGVEVDHQEYNPQSMSQEEKFILIEKFKRFVDVYIEWFGESPPKWIWPELILDSWETKDEHFVSINIYKTVLMKLFIK